MSEQTEKENHTGPKELLRMNYLERMLFGKLDLDKTEQRRRMFIAFCIAIGVSAIVILDVLDFFETKPIGLVFDGIAVAVFLANFLILRTIKKSVNLFRLDALLLGFLFLSYMTDGGKGGGSIMWSFPYPVITVFLLGKKEGIIWTLCFLAGACVLLFVPDLFDTYNYYPELQVRYMVSFSIITVLAYIIESLRQRFEEESTASISKLEKALAEVKTLKGLLPICSHCKKVRDDKGYWNRIENYVSERTDAEFTHGLCPDCITELYPEISEELLNPDKTSR